MDGAAKSSRDISVERRTWPPLPRGEDRGEGEQNPAAAGAIF